MALCTECEAEIILEDTTEVGEIIQCPDCGMDLEVISVDPPEVAPAPEEEEDWANEDRRPLLARPQGRKALVRCVPVAGLEFVRLDDRELILDLHQRQWDFDVILERCINHSRALHTMRYFADCGVKTVNTYEVANTAATSCSPRSLSSATRSPPSGSRRPHAGIRAAGD